MGSLIKKELRRQILNYRRLLDPIVFAERNHQLNKRIEQLLANQACQELHVFLPMKSNKEPDCYPMIRRAWMRGISTITTKTDFSTRTLKHLRFDANSSITDSSRGIPEPISGIETDLSNTDIIFVPLIAFDRQGQRIGYGGGYYDIILSQMKQKTLKVGLSLSGGMDAFNFAEAHDQMLDIILTPFETVKIHE